MATTTEQLQAFTQSVYLVIKGRYFDDITGADGTTLINETIDWTNQYLDELESELDPNGRPVNWRWMRENGYSLGAAVTGASAIDTPDEILNLVSDEERYLQILDATGKVLSDWAVVDAAEISNVVNEGDRCALVGEQIVFSRVFNSMENGGSIVGDVTLSLPRLATNDTEVLDIVQPKQLLILGVAKNASLPDIVQGGLSPSYAQKYNDLLTNAIARNTASTRPQTAQREDYGYISGVGF